MITFNDFYIGATLPASTHIFQSRNLCQRGKQRSLMKTDVAVPFRRRILRVPEADYMHEWDTALTAHSDAHLAAIKSDGYDAVWLRGVLREIVRTDLFPKLAPQAEEHLHTLNTL